jgi:thymidylate kinase
MKGKVPKGRRARWTMYLQQYKFEIVHRSGKENKNADALSRLRFEKENINKELKSQGEEIITMERRNEQKFKYVKIEDKWYDGRKIKRKWEEMKYFTDREAILLNLDKETEEILLKRLNRKKKPQLIIIDGVDGVGKFTVVESLMKQLGEKDGLKLIFNKFKRRRNDDKRFEKPSKRYKWLFRKQVVEEINRRMITYDDEDIIILDKSPYSEYFYQQTKSLDRGVIDAYGNYRMEKEIFRHKEIIDNAIVIFLKNKNCWNNYIDRETKKNDEGHKSSWETLSEEKYMDMVNMFREHQTVYNDTEKYKKIEIKNDNKSWRKIYQEIKKFLDKQ